MRPPRNPHSSSHDDRVREDARLPEEGESRPRESDADDAKKQEKHSRSSRALERWRGWSPRLTPALPQSMRHHTVEPQADDDAVMIDESVPDSYAIVHYGKESSPLGESDDPPARLSARRQERKRERRTIRLKRVGYVLAAVLVIFGVAWSALYSPLFALSNDRITVDVPADGIVDSSQVAAAASQFVGTSLVRLNTGAVGTAVEAVQNVKDVSVSRDWPRGITVTVTQRVPIACLLANDVCTAIDEDGQRLTVSQDQADALPRMTLADTSTDAGTSTTSMLSVLAALDSSTRTAVTEISVDKNQQLTLSLATGARVFWGEPENNEFKATVLGILLAQNAQYYDVSSPSAPVTQ